MSSQGVDPHHFVSRAHQIKAQLPTILSEWGLLPRFKRWRLAQDPDTGTAVLFGVLNNRYIAMHTTTPFSDYFDPRLLRDIATKLQVQVIPSANDGLRYAFILERGQVGHPKDVPALPSGVAAEAMPAPASTTQIFERYAVAPTATERSVLLDELVVRQQRLTKFLIVADALNALNNIPSQPLPDILRMDEFEFNQKITGYETSRIRTKLKSQKGEPNG
ncbi:hypothetical protein GW781_08795 [bacterium]|nr:hypothetical protein [bacterium]NCT21237.1 hypothetical protein [bacterium]